jgi:hypothetical protein
VSNDPGTSPTPTLPADRAFVVQFPATAGPPLDGTRHGRIEHLLTGDARKFTAWSELHDFVEQTLVRAALMATLDKETHP